MRFWDASAVIPLVIHEAATDHLLPISRDDAVVAVWWATPVECESALARRIRQGELDAAAERIAFDELARLETMWTEIMPTAALRDEARRLLHRYALRAADAFQLASAFVAADGSPAKLPFVCLDGRLNDAARREGFPVVS